METTKKFNTYILSTANDNRVIIIRLMSIPLFIIMMTAFVTTKWPLLTEKGFWVFAHEYRTDFAVTLLLIYLLIYGGGALSVDSKFYNSSKT